MRNFKSRVAESFADYKSHYSDWRNADAMKKRKADEDIGGHKNHKFNKYENYFSGYETTMDMPKGKVAKAFTVPMIIALISGYLIHKNRKKPKDNECLDR